MSKAYVHVSVHKHPGGPCGGGGGGEGGGGGGGGGGGVGHNGAVARVPQE